MFFYLDLLSLMKRIADQNHLSNYRLQVNQEKKHLENSIGSMVFIYIANVVNLDNSLCIILSFFVTPIVLFVLYSIWDQFVPTFTWQT